ncbi:MarR family transcriptional regulator [Streptomyces sp. H10-C2]|uniref:MarR family winged helix-turn-helix transcriptional regulator n=1 Tax=unclassified Streptomyces TaxID=2593676 RepID=UPI0024BA89DB|nr:MULTISPECIES: MarR family transcriptional regulator [unclassified Streptomyces]MDJ0347408.1 MarR family transcriptional regulator [Streptomyces sp. PH10-H1]MDJ0375687.1 MarR family transcriptional regulator [Streptomyces sp. H10-C2]
MDTRDDTGTADMAGSADDQATPARLRGLPSRLLSLTAVHADRLVSEGLAGADARKWHYAVLVALEEFGPASQAALSDRTRVYRSDLVAVINQLADRGLVERAPDPADRRRNVITMTPQGRRHLRRLDTLLSAIQDDLLAPLTQPERDQLAQLLTRLLEHHTRTPAPSTDDRPA